jgi:predicted MFS family arabinose efflux permease
VWLLEIDWRAVVLCLGIVGLILLMCFLVVWIVKDANREGRELEADQKLIAELEAEKTKDPPKT